MLVLNRKVGERIRIGGDVEICLVAIRGESVRIGIEAPAMVRVMRTELLPKRDEFGELLDRGDPQE